MTADVPEASQEFPAFIKGDGFAADTPCEPIMILRTVVFALVLALYVSPASVVGIVEDFWILKAFKSLDLQAQRAQLPLLLNNWNGDGLKLSQTILALNILNSETLSQCGFFLKHFMAFSDQFEEIIVHSNGSGLTIINALINQKNYEAAEYLIRKYHGGQCHELTLKYACHEFKDNGEPEEYPLVPNRIERIEDQRLNRFVFVRKLLIEFDGARFFNNQQSDHLDSSPLSFVLSRRLAFLLIDHGATIDLRNSLGQTLLHRAGAFKWMEIFEFYLEIGLDPNLKDIYGRTPGDFLAAL